MLERGVLFVPQALDGKSDAPLLVFMHGGNWIPEVAAARTGRAVLHWQANGGYATPFEQQGAFEKWTDEAADRAGMKWSRIELGGWSAGCGGIRQILRHDSARQFVARVLMIDGVHAPYTNGKPGPLESELDTAKLDGIAAFARSAIAGEKRLLILHTEIFPGTFASTTETADWLLRELRVPRTAVLKWGPLRTQQLSEAGAGGFDLLGFAGNSAPDHVDLLHALPAWLLRIDAAPASR